MKSWIVVLFGAVVAIAAPSASYAANPCTPEGNGHVTTASADKPEGAGRVVIASSAAEGNGAVVNANGKAEGNGAVVNASGAMPEGNGNFVKASSAGCK